MIGKIVGSVGSKAAARVAQREAMRLFMSNRAAGMTDDAALAASRVLWKNTFERVATEQAASGAARTAAVQSVAAVTAADATLTLLPSSVLSFTGAPEVTIKTGARVS